ncbi:MAG TPA: GlsB/YeaQ/YmgE family stress response membrane protein [bacterium]
MNWIVSLIIGGVIGWLASIVMKTNAQMGWIANVLVGIIGSSLGFWVAGLLGIVPVGGVLHWVIAVAGAALLIAILRAVGVFRG